MKTCLFPALMVCLGLLLLTPNPASSQNATPVGNNIGFANLGDWIPTENWLHAFRSAFGKQANPQWVCELSLDGQFYQNPNTGSLLVVLDDYLYADSQLNDKLEYGIVEGHDTQLLPLLDAMERLDSQWYARFLGKLGGVPASLDMMVFERKGKFVTVMGFYPGQTVENAASEDFKQAVHHFFENPVLANGE